MAGAGTGRMPWAHFTVPDPVQTGEAITSSGASSSIKRQTLTMSAMASIVPTSWKWMLSMVVLWALDSAWAMRL